MVHVGLCNSKTDCYCRDIMEQVWDMNTAKLNRYTKVCWCFDTGLICHCCTDEDYTRITKTREEFPTFELWYTHMIKQFLIADKKRQAERAKFNNNIEKEVKDILGYKPTYKWLTITFSKELSPSQIESHQLNLMKKKLYENSVSVIEFTGAEGQYHPHIHSLILSEKTKTFQKNKLLKDISRICKVKMNFVDISDEPALFHTRCNYIYGQKKDLKMSQVEADRKVRMEHSFKEVYENGNIEKIKSELDI